MNPSSDLDVAWPDDVRSSTLLTVPRPRGWARRTRHRRSVASGGVHVVVCAWRDLRHPESGGSERYVETIARELAARGNTVTLICSAIDGQPADEVRDGIHYRRRGGRNTVYLHAAWALLSRRVRPDIVVDVQNGVPFLSPAMTRRPVAVLVHHVHREQWRIFFGRKAARIGWWIESRLAPVLYRRSPYVAVSEATRHDLSTLGVDPERVSIVHNGTPALPAPRVGRSPSPRLIVLGRLVEHKRVEIVLRALGALRSGSLPGLELDVVGRGPHEDALREEAGRLGVADAVTFHGYVDEQTKADLLAGAWVNVVPSIKEGWALTVVEAGQLGTPSIAFTGTGGLSESIVHGLTGILVDGDESAFADALIDLLTDDGTRCGLGAAARSHAAAFTWDDAVGGFIDVLDACLDGGR